MSYSRYIPKDIIDKFEKWGLLTKNNITALQQSQDIDLLSQIMCSLLEISPDIYLDQSDFEIMLTHAHLDEMYKIFLELKKANITLDQYSFDKIISADCSRLYTIIIFLKHQNVFDGLTQQMFDDFIQTNDYFSVKQFLNLFIYDCLSNQNIHLEMYADFFMELASVLSKFPVEETSDALFELIVESQNQGKHKIELLLTVENETDPSLFLDLINVIKMRVKMCLEKGNALLVMPEKIFRDIIEAGVNISGIYKLSFLHHHVHDALLESVMDLSYQEKIGNYVKHMPDLKEIVLRSCATVEPDFDNYKLKILESSQDISSIQAPATTLIILQKQENGLVTTYVKYQKHGLKENRIFTTISLHNNNNEFSTKELEEISKYCDITLKSALPVLKKDPSLIKKFYNGEEMTREEMLLVKKMMIRARTENRKDFGNQACMTNFMMKMLIEANYHGTLKGYIKGYKIINNRVVPVHGVNGIDVFPKAVRVKIEGNAPEEKVNPIAESTTYALMNFSENMRYTLFYSDAMKETGRFQESGHNNQVKKYTLS